MAQEPKYYRLLSGNMVHHDFQWKEGLNVDTNEFTYDEICGGGLFFCERKDIHYWISHTTFLIADVTLPDDARVVHFINKSKADKVILSNIRPITDFDLTLQEHYSLGKRDNSPRVFTLQYFEQIPADATDEELEFLIQRRQNIHTFCNIKKPWVWGKLASSNHFKFYFCELWKNTEWIKGITDDMWKEMIKAYPIFIMKVPHNHPLHFELEWLSVKWSNSVDQLVDPTQEMIDYVEKATYDETKEKETDEEETDDEKQKHFEETTKQEQFHRDFVALFQGLPLVSNLLCRGCIYGSVIRWGAEFYLRGEVPTQEQFDEYVMSHDIDIHCHYIQMNSLLKELKKVGGYLESKLSYEDRINEKSFNIWVPYKGKLVLLDINSHSAATNDYTINDNQMNKKEITWNLQAIKAKKIILYDKTPTKDTKIAKVLFRCSKLLQQGYTLSGKQLFRLYFNLLEYIESWKSMVPIGDHSQPSWPLDTYEKVREGKILFTQHKYQMLTKEYFTNHPDMIALRRMVFEEVDDES